MGADFKEYYYCEWLLVSCPFLQISFLACLIMIAYFNFFYHIKSNFTSK